MDDNIIRVRVPQELAEAIDNEAARLKLRPSEIARLAIALGMRAMTQQVTLTTSTGTTATLPSSPVHRGQAIGQSGWQA